MVTRPTDIGRDAERDLDEVAQIGVVNDGADLTEEVRGRRGQRRQALHDLTAAGADVLPLHRDQPDLARVEEEVDDGGGREAPLLAESEGVDAHEFLVIRASDELGERVEQVAFAGNRHSKPLEALLEQLLVYNPLQRFFPLLRTRLTLPPAARLVPGAGF